MDAFFPGEININRVTTIKPFIIRVDVTCIKHTKVMYFEVTLNLEPFMHSGDEFNLYNNVFAEIEKLYPTAEFIAEHTNSFRSA